MSVTEDLADGVPIVLQQGGAHGDGCVADAFKDLEYLSVAIDVTFCYLPVVSARIARLARVTDDNAALERRDVDLDRLAFHPGGAEMDGRCAAILCRVVILVAGWYAYDLAFDRRRDR